MKRDLKALNVIAGLLYVMSIAPMFGESGSPERQIDVWVPESRLLDVWPSKLEYFDVGTNRNHAESQLIFKMEIDGWYLVCRRFDDRELGESWFEAYGLPITASNEGYRMTGRVARLVSSLEIPKQQTREDIPIDRAEGKVTIGFSDSREIVLGGKTHRETEVSSVVNLLAGIRWDAPSRANGGALDHLGIELVNGRETVRLQIGIPCLP